MARLHGARGLRRLALVGCAALLAARPGLAQEPTLVRLQPPAKTTVWVGERLRFQIELLSPTFFKGAPRIALPEAAGLILMRVDDRPVVDSTTIDGDTYSRQTHSLVAFAARAGRHTVPPIEVGFGVAGAGGDPGRSVSASTTPFEFEARQPPGATGLVPACRGLVVEESWQPLPTGEARVGDAFRRSLTIRAEDTTAMLLPPLPELELDGFATYLSEPEVDDSTQRGEFRAERRQFLTFLCNAPGRRRIPALKLSWFDLDTQELRVETLPAVELSVAAADEGPAEAAAAQIANESARSLSPWRTLAVIALLLVAIASVAFVLLRYRQAPERVAFRALLAACESNTPARVDRALCGWLATLPSPRPRPTADDLGRLPGGDVVARELLAMQAAWVGAAGSWSGERLPRALAELRRLLVRRRLPPSAAPELPAGLNPGRHGG